MQQRFIYLVVYFLLLLLSSKLILAKDQSEYLDKEDVWQEAINSSRGKKSEQVNEKFDNSQQAQVKKQKDNSQQALVKEQMGVWKACNNQNIPLLQGLSKRL